MSATRYLAPTLAVAAALSACLTVAPRPAVAGAVYRCNGAHGQLAFTNNPAGYSGCRQVSSYAETASKPAAAPKSGAGYRSTPAVGDDAVGSLAAPAEAPEPAEERETVHRGAVYKVTRANGVTEYTNIPPRGARAYRVLFTYISTCYACNVHSNINWSLTALNRNAYRDEVAAAAEEFGVDAALLRAVIHAESAFNPNAISTAGAEGLMQLIPGTASDMGVANPFDARQNIRGGAQYLSGLLKQFNGNERLATAAYNAGPQNVVKYNGVPPFDETRVYVDRVATLHQRYRSAE
jgi:soluble lytic murein transglycosylase-like protein